MEGQWVRAITTFAPLLVLTVALFLLLKGLVRRVVV
jgi:hypothetical protein